MSASGTMRNGVVKRGATWSYVVRERDPESGKTKPRWRGGFKTRTEAVAARASAQNAQARGTYVAPSKVTVGQWLDLWIRGHELELKASTAESYRANIERYLKPRLGHERLQGLSPAKLTATFRELHEKGGHNGKALSPRTVEFARAVLRRALQDAVLERLIEVNPVVGSRRPKVEKPKHTTWTGGQLATYLARDDYALAPLFALAAATGMRRGELLALRWADVDLDGARLNIERAVVQIGQARRYGTPKNHERRQVTLDAKTVATLRALRRRTAADRLKWGTAYSGTEDLVFTWENGSALLPDYVSKEFVRTQRGLELPRLKLHELRHTHATLLLRAGVPVHVVAKRLGHKDPSVTLNVYADAIPDDDGRAVDAFTKAVHGA